MHRIEALITSCGFSLAFEVIVTIVNICQGIEGSTMDKACLFDFIIRQWEDMSGVEKAKRVMNLLHLGKRTNRCGTCGNIGHNKNYCWHS